MHESVCKICENTHENRVHEVREMMFGLRDKFRYLECGQCGCLQLMDTINDPGKYYPSQYVSFVKTTPQKMSLFRKFLFRTRIKQVLEPNTFLGSWLLKRGKPAIPAWIAKAKLKLNDRILDVGCGSGALLNAMKTMGFRSLKGVDPYIEKSTNHNNIHLIKDNQENIGGLYDCIMFHHSFEHMSDPINVLHATARMLDKHQKAIIRIPVMGKYAWRKYGVDWVGIDAPRHFFLHTEKSMELVAHKAGFTIDDISYDSIEMQFWGSEQYKRNIPLKDPQSYTENPLQSCFTLDQIKEYKEAAKRLNAEADGDAACFILRKS